MKGGVLLQSITEKILFEDMQTNPPRQKYFRTPSGSNLKIKVGQTRTIFSHQVGSLPINEYRSLNSQQVCQSETSQPQNRVQRAAKHSQLCITDHGDKQTNQHVHKALTPIDLSDTESDNYATPPSKPLTSKAL